jgi:DNA-binding response OmpR family regulator
MTQRLLVIEDSPTQLLAIKKALETEGYQIIEAKNGAEGLARAYNEYPDLIITDVVMSGINGYQLCRLVKNDSDLSEIPVILLTKLDGSVDRFWGFKSGADRYIPKEPGFPSLIRAVRELLAEAKGNPLKLASDPNRNPTPEEINNRLNQLLERLLFEATIVDEVRRIGEDILDLEVIAEKLFGLLASILTYQAAALVVNQGTNSQLLIDFSRDLSNDQVRSYVAKLALQLGLPPLKDESVRGSSTPDNALTQTIDMSGLRLGLLVVIPHSKQVYKPGDQKVVRLICEQLSVVLRLYQSYAQRIGAAVPMN